MQTRTIHDQSAMPNIHPTITADQLGIYLMSPPTRRRALLEVAKYSGIFADPWVKARAVAVDVMLGRVLPDELRDHAPMRGGRALAAFFSAWHRDRTIRDVPHSPVLEVVGVKVTAAAPDVLTRHRVGHRVRLGGVAFAFEPRAPERARRTRCALMHRALERLCGPDSFTTVEDAAVLSLASGELLSGGPTTVVWRDIEAACAEVRRVWSSV